MPRPFLNPGPGSHVHDATAPTRLTPCFVFLSLHHLSELGRVASHFYIRHSSIVTFNEHLRPHMSEADVLAMIAESSEFENLAVRDEELPELDTLVRDACPYDVKGGGADSKQGKANVLLQVCGVCCWGCWGGGTRRAGSGRRNMRRTEQCLPRLCLSLLLAHEG